MKELRTLSDEQIDLIKAKVGNSKLYLKAISHHRAFNAVSKEILPKLKFKYKTELSNFIACAVSALKKNDSGFTYSRDVTTYTLFNKTIIDRPKSSYKSTMSLYDELEELGYIENYKGFKDVNGGVAMSACVIFTEGFIKLFDVDKISKFGKVIRDKSVEVRDDEGNILDIDTSDMQRKVDEIIDWLGTHKFTFGIWEKKIYLQRVYNGNLNVSGRFYFGYLQTIKSEKRQTYQIDRFPVSELDFSSNHFCILAAKQNFRLPDDFKPYDVDISDLVTMSDGYDKIRARKLTKLACMMLINSGKPTTSFKNMWQSNIDLITKLLDDGKFKEAKENPFYGVSGKKNSKKIIDRLVKHNSYARDYFFTKQGQWGYCQHIDSEIMFNILWTLKGLDIPVIPYHDSVILRKQDEDVVRSVMEGSWRKVLGTDLNCRIDKKF